jgi:hypothetical protein
MEIRKKPDCNCNGIVSIDIGPLAVLADAGAKYVSAKQASAHMQRQIEGNKCKFVSWLSEVSARAQLP